MPQQAAHELHVWSKCTHPCVQELVGVAYVRNQIAMVSQWLEYGTLPEYLKNDRTADRCKMAGRFLILSPNTDTFTLVYSNY